MNAWVKWVTAKHLVFGMEIFAVAVGVGGATDDIEQKMLLEQKCAVGFDQNRKIPK